MNDRQTIAANKAAREEAEAALSLLTSNSPRVYQELIKLAQARLAELVPTTPPPAAMTPEELERRLWRVERSVFPRGQFQGATVAQVPNWYLLRWANRDKFTQELEWYITTRRFRERQSLDGDDRDDE